MTAALAIVMVEAGEGQIAVMPIFVAITPRMELIFPGERDSAGPGGGPKNPHEAFKLNKGLTRYARPRHPALRQSDRRPAPRQG